MENLSITFNAFTSNNKKYEININIENEEMIIKTEFKNENDLFSNYYFGNYSFSILKNNKIFSLFDNLTEIIELISNLILENNKNDRNAIIIEETNEIILFIPMNFGKYKEIIFNLPEKTKDSSEKLTILLDEYKKIKQKNDDLEIENKKLKEELENKNNEIQRLNNQCLEFQKKFSDLNCQISFLESSKLTFTIRSKCKLDSCLDTKDLNEGNSPHLWEYNHNNKNQLFRLIKNEDNTYTFQNAFSNLYLGADNYKLVLSQKNKNDQKMKVTHFDDGFFLFQFVSGPILDLGNFKTDNGSPIGLTGLNQSEAQQWKLIVNIP